MSLNPHAIAIANQRLWKAFPELRGRQLRAGPGDAAYRRAWLRYYHAAAHAAPKPPKARQVPKVAKKLPKTVIAPVQACVLQALMGAEQVAAQAIERLSQMALVQAFSGDVQSWASALVTADASVYKDILSAAPGGAQGASFGIITNQLAAVVEPIDALHNNRTKHPPFGATYDLSCSNTYPNGSVSVNNVTYPLLSQLRDGLAANLSPSDAQHACLATVYAMIAGGLGLPTSNIANFWLRNGRNRHEAYEGKPELPFTTGGTTPRTFIALDDTRLQTWFSGSTTGGTNLGIIRGTLYGETHYMLALNVNSTSVLAIDPLTGTTVTISRNSGTVETIMDPYTGKWQKLDSNACPSDQADFGYGYNKTTGKLDGSSLYQELTHFSGAQISKIGLGKPATH